MDKDHPKEAETPPSGVGESFMMVEPPNPNDSMYKHLLNSGLSSGFNWDKGRKLAPSAEQKEGKADMPPPAEEEELPPGSKSELVGGSSPVDQPQSHKQCASADDLKMEKPARHYDAQIAQAKAGEAASHWGDRIDGTSSAPVLASNKLNDMQFSGTQSQPTGNITDGTRTDNATSSPMSIRPKSISPVPPRAACTTPNNVDTYTEQTEWVWIAVGVIAVAGSLFAGRRLFEYWRGGTKPERV